MAFASVISASVDRAPFCCSASLPGVPADVNGVRFVNQGMSSNRPRVLKGGFYSDLKERRLVIKLRQSMSRKGNCGIMLSQSHSSAH
jgi:hypothetical protein